MYMATVGFLAGWGGALSNLYEEEINKGVVNKSLLITTGTVMGIIVVLALSIRIMSGCDSYVTAFCGLAFGLMIGFVGCITLGYSTDRKATNIWGIPLLKSRGRIQISNPE